MPVQPFKKTPKQIEAIRMMVKKKHTLLSGGSRSGKTAIIIRSIIIRACRMKSRHLSLRHTFSAAKTSLWMDTIPKVLELCFPGLPPISQLGNNSDYFLRFPNGSEYWIGGLDDNKRAEKILGTEFSTIHFNECSQLSYNSVQIALTRLSQKNPLKKRAYYDQNPPRKSHWSYVLFEMGLNPIDNVPFKNMEQYGSMLMNPSDNIDNIDPDYINMLNSMSEKDRDRFLHGKYTDTDDGIVYYSFLRETHVKKVKREPGTVMIGMDFNVNPMTAVVGQYVDNIFYVLDEVFLNNSDTFKMCNELTSRNYMGDIYPDSTGRNRKTSGMSDHVILESHGFIVKRTKNPFIADRVNNLNRLLQEGRIIIDSRCVKLINDLEKVTWKGNELEQNVDKMLTHVSDALGYWCWAIEPIKHKTENRVNISRI